MLTSRSIVARRHLAGLLAVVMEHQPGSLDQTGKIRHRTHRGARMDPGEEKRLGTVERPDARQVPLIEQSLTDRSSRVGAESRQAVDVGFAGKACIHPSHVPVIRAAFRPSDEEAEWARAVLAADDGGVFTFGGRMIDGPVIAQARQILSRADSPAK